MVLMCLTSLSALSSFCFSFFKLSNAIFVVCSLGKDCKNQQSELKYPKGKKENKLLDKAMYTAF